MFPNRKSSNAFVVSTAVLASVGFALPRAVFFFTGSGAGADSAGGASGSGTSGLRGRPRAFFAGGFGSSRAERGARVSVVGTTSTGTFFAGRPSFRFIVTGLASDVAGARDGAGAATAAHEGCSTTCLFVLVVLVILEAASGAALGGALAAAGASAGVLCSDFVNRVLRRAAGAGSVRTAF